MIESIKQATMAQQAPPPPPQPQKQQQTPPPPADNVEVYEPEEKYSNELVVKKPAVGANKRETKNNNKK